MRKKFVVFGVALVGMSFQQLMSAIVDVKPSGIAIYLTLLLFGLFLLGLVFWQWFMPAITGVAIAIAVCFLPLTHFSILTLFAMFVVLCAGWYFSLAILYHRLALSEDVGLFRKLMSKSHGQAADAVFSREHYLLQEKLSVLKVSWILYLFVWLVAYWYFGMMGLTIVVIILFIVMITGWNNL